MNWVIFLIIGLVAGWLAGQVLKGRGFGLVGDLVVGVIGSFVGGYLFDLLRIPIGGGVIGSFVVAFIGALLLVWLIRLIVH